MFLKKVRREIDLNYFFIANDKKYYRQNIGVILRAFQKKTLDRDALRSIMVFIIFYFNVPLRIHLADIDSLTEKYGHSM